MPSWYYDQNAFHKTPSIQDGMDYETECAYRKEGARFIMDIGTQMDLGCNTMATGVVFFHRFYMFHSFIAFPRFVTACCCIFLAGKVEETPKKCKDIIKIAQTLLNEEAFSSFGMNPKEEVMALEKVLLKTVKFDFKVEHPYFYLIKYAKHLKGDKNRLHKMVQMAWTFINDSLCTTLCLQWEPEIIAIALMYLAGKLSKFKVTGWVIKKPYHTKWWDMFVQDLPMPTLEDICHQVLDLYSTVKDQSQKSQEIQSQIIKKETDIKIENAIKHEQIDSQQIPIKTEENSLHFEPKIVKEDCSNITSIKQESSIDSTLTVNVKKELEVSQVYDPPKPNTILRVAEWAAASASAIMSPGTSSVNSPLFSTPNFLISPVSVGSFNNRFNDPMIHQNVNFKNNLSENSQEFKNVTPTLFGNQNGTNSNDVTRHKDQIHNFNKFRNNVSLDNCRDNLLINSRGFDNFNDNLVKSSRGFGDCSNSLPRGCRGFNDCNINLPKSSQGFDSGNDPLPKCSRRFNNRNDEMPKDTRRFDTYTDNLPRNSQKFDNCNDNFSTSNRGFDCNNDVPFRSRGFDNVIENSLDNTYKFKISDFSKNYLSCDTFIQDYPDSKNLYNKFKCSTKIRNDRDPRTNSRDYPYPTSKNDMNMNSFPESNNNSYENDIRRYRSKQSGRRFKQSRRFQRPMNN